MNEKYTHINIHAAPKFVGQREYSNPTYEKKLKYCEILFQSINDSESLSRKWNITMQNGNWLSDFLWHKNVSYFGLPHNLKVEEKFVLKEPIRAIK